MFLVLLLVIIFSNVYSEDIYCTGHDACKNKIWNGEYNIYCGASNSERTCKYTTLNCDTNKDCSVKTQGSGHDAYQNSVVNAKKSNSFKLTCQASGQRDCQSITVWCPQSYGTTCECVNCPSSVVMKCVKGITCDSVSNANIDYVEPDVYQIPDTIWKKYTNFQGKRPNCLKIITPPSNQNYKWGTLQQCKTRCIEEPTGKCNAISRYGEGIKLLTENFHCRFYACENPYNFTWVDQTQWGNYASSCNSYLMPIRRYTLESRYVNKTQILNMTRFIDKVRFIDTPRIINETHIINETRIINKTRFIDTIRFIYKTLYINKTRYINETRYIDKIQIKNQTRENIINSSSIINSGDSDSIINNNSIISEYDTVDNNTRENNSDNYNFSTRETIMLVICILIIMCLGCRIVYVDFCTNCDTKQQKKELQLRYIESDNITGNNSKDMVVINAFPVIN
jgi:hypothetical protein